MSLMGTDHVMPCKPLGPVELFAALLAGQFVVWVGGDSGQMRRFFHPTCRPVGAGHHG